MIRMSSPATREISLTTRMIPGFRLPTGRFEYTGCIDTPSGVVWCGGFGSNTVVDVAVPFEFTLPVSPTGHTPSPQAGVLEASSTPPPPAAPSRPIFQTAAMPPGDEGIAGRDVFAAMLPRSHSLVASLLTSARAASDCLHMASFTLGLLASELAIRGECESVITALLRLVVATPGALARATLAKISRRYLGDAGAARAVLSLWALPAPSAGNGDSPVLEARVTQPPPSLVRGLTALFEMGAGLAVTTSIEATAEGGGSLEFAVSPATLGCAGDAALLELLLILLRAGAWTAVSATLVDEIILVASSTIGHVLAAAREAHETFSTALARPTSVTTCSRASVASTVQLKAWVQKLMLEMLLPSSSGLMRDEAEKNSERAVGGLARSAKIMSHLTCATGSPSRASNDTEIRRMGQKDAADAAALQDALVRRIEFRMSALVAIACEGLSTSIYMEREIVPRELLSSGGDMSTEDFTSKCRTSETADTPALDYISRGTPARSREHSPGPDAPAALRERPTRQPATSPTRLAPSASPEFAVGFRAREKPPMMISSSPSPRPPTSRMPPSASAPVVGSVSPRPNLPLGPAQAPTKSLYRHVDDSFSRTWLTPVGLGTGGRLLVGVENAGGRATDTPWAASAWSQQQIAQNDLSGSMRDLVAFAVIAVKELGARGKQAAQQLRLVGCVGRAITRLSPSTISDYDTLLRAGAVVARCEPACARHMASHILSHWPRTDDDKARALVPFLATVFPLWWPSHGAPSAPTRALLARFIERLCLMIRSSHGVVANEAVLAVLPVAAADEQVAASRRHTTAAGGAGSEKEGAPAASPSSPVIPRSRSRGAAPEASLFEKTLLGHPRELLAVARALSANVGVRHTRLSRPLRPEPRAQPQAGVYTPPCSEIRRPQSIVTKGPWDAESAAAVDASSPRSVLSDARSVFSSGSNCGSVSLGSISASSSFSSLCEMAPSTPTPRECAEQQLSPRSQGESPRHRHRPNSPLSATSSRPSSFLTRGAGTTDNVASYYSPPLAYATSTSAREFATRSPRNDDASARAKKRPVAGSRLRTSGRRLLLLSCASIRENFRRALAVHAADKAFREHSATSTVAASPDATPSPGATPVPYSPPQVAASATSPRATRAERAPAHAHWSVTLRYNSLVALSLLERRAQERYPTAFGASACSKIEAAISRSLVKRGLKAMAGGEASA